MRNELHSEEWHFETTKLASHRKYDEMQWKTHLYLEGQDW